MILEKMMEVYDRYSEHQEKKAKARSNNRARHSSTKVRQD